MNVKTACAGSFRDRSDRGAKLGHLLFSEELV